MWTLTLIVIFLVLSGIGDALGFVHAGKIWHDGRVVWAEAAKSALGFQLGAVCFWMALRHLQAVGVVAPETTTLLWFGATIIGVALLSGRFLGWHLAEQAVAVAVLLGIGWLMARTGA